MLILLTRKRGNVVALRKESVDRNKRWCVRNYVDEPVALRKESVDRNANFGGFFWWVEGSLSARRAWIEILVGDDGNEVNQGRSPQGERG